MTRPSTDGATELPVAVVCQRSDSQRRAIVDRAIAMQVQSNTVCAIEFLKSNDIDARLIERVLLDPERRRPVSH
jgi:hypothetical protein